jgi:hypothetical protein
MFETAMLWLEFSRSSNRSLKYKVNFILCCKVLEDGRIWMQKTNFKICFFNNSYSEGVCKVVESVITLPRDLTSKSVFAAAT